MSDFNFDEWARLYETDPEEYERQRKMLLEKHIMSVPIKHRNMLRMLQLEVDTIREMYPPDQAFEIISGMMVDKLKDLRAKMTELREIMEDLDEE